MQQTTGRQTADAANHRPAQQHPCGSDSRPGKLHLSEPTPPLCSPLCRHGSNNTAADNVQTFRSDQWGVQLFTIFGFEREIVLAKLKEDEDNVAKRLA
jgi:hypothetical protein